MSFGERMQAVRKQGGLTQEEFAGELQVSRQAVSKWESGRGYPELEKILYICARWGTTMDALFADELPPQVSGAEPEPEPERTLPVHTLGGALGTFYANLSPYNKLVGGILLLVLAFLAPAYVYISRLLEGGDNMEAVIWIAAIVVFGVAEAATAGLVSIWFLLGAVAALIAAELGGELWLQAALFLAVSTAALLATRPLAKKMLDKRITATNADRVLHRSARVTERVDNEHSSGAVYVDGKTWSARSEDGTVIPKDSMVTVLRMEGVKLFVRPLSAAPAGK